MVDHDAIERARESFARRAWRDTLDTFTLAEAHTSLAGDDLERLAVCEFMLGSEQRFIQAIGRAHHAYVTAGAVPDAIRAAAWAGIGHLQRGEVGPASGWFRRAQRLADELDHDCVERRYLEIPEAIRASIEGAHDVASDVAHRIAAAARVHGEHDLFALAVTEEGRAHIRSGDPGTGIPLLDEAMVTVTTADVSPMVAGIVYCSVIEGCHEAFALQRAGDWTKALQRWCDRQTDLVQFTGRCHVHQAEILQFHGAWDEALAEANRARVRLENVEPSNPARAYLRLAELHRLRGQLTLAADAYEETAKLGGDVQPGLSLLRLAEGHTASALSTIERVLSETPRPLDRARLLPASVEIHLAADRIDVATEQADELQVVADAAQSAILRAHADLALASVALARGEASRALPLLRRAADAWRTSEAAYEEANTRVAIGRACRALGDDDGAAMEFASARAIFERLGARPALESLDAITGRDRHEHGLTDRELEVLRLVAAGKTNRQIADHLFLSVKTIDRHVSNIFTKLGVSSRTAAAAFAYEHDLI